MTLLLADLEDMRFKNHEQQGERASTCSSSGSGTAWRFRNCDLDVCTMEVAFLICNRLMLSKSHQILSKFGSKLACPRSRELHSRNLAGTIMRIAFKFCQVGLGCMCVPSVLMAV